jgi:hypothetical protein
MWNLVIIVAVVCVLFFVWARMDYKKKMAGRGEKAYKPPFRTEDDLKSYEKPLKDEEHSTIDLDDAE